MSLDPAGRQRAPGPADRHDHHAHDHHDHHGHGPHHGHVHGASGRLGVAFGLNVAFTLVELVGAWWTGSTAIAADAVHDLGDTVALALAWVLERLSRRPGDADWSFGFRRLTLVGAVINAIVLLVGGALVLWEAAPRVLHPTPTDAAGMFGLAILGIAVNGLAAWRASGGQTLNEQVVTWHLLEDVLGWVAVAVGGLVMLVADVPWLDPALAIAVTLFIAQGTVRRLWASLRLLLQATPADVDLHELVDALGDVPGVVAVRHLHVWSQDGAFHVMTARLDVVVGATITEADAIRDAAAAVAAGRGVAHTTLEVRAASAPPDACVALSGGDPDASTIPGHDFTAP